MTTVLPVAMAIGMGVTVRVVVAEAGTATVNVGTEAETELPAANVTVGVIELIDTVVAPVAANTLSVANCVEVPFEITMLAPTDNVVGSGEVTMLVTGTPEVNGVANVAAVDVNAVPMGYAALAVNELTASVVAPTVAVVDTTADCGVAAVPSTTIEPAGNATVKGATVKDVYVVPLTKADVN